MAACSETGKLLQCGLRFRRQLTELVDHQVNHVLRVSLGADASEIPGPRARGCIERDQAFVGERGQEPDREERIPAGLLMDELREGDGLRWCATQRIRDERLQMFAAEGRQRDLLDLRTRAADGLELAHERMGRVHFVVPIGADHQQMAQVGAEHQLFEQIERRHIDPMQIVEEECQGMFRLGECANEAPEGDLEQPAGLLRRKIGIGGCSPTISSSSGTSSITSRPCAPSDSLNAVRQPSSSASLLLIKPRISPWRDWTIAR